MTKGFVTVSSLLLLIALLLTAAAFAPPSSPFFGTWQADDIDGSNLILVLARRGHSGARVRIFDDGATVCGSDASGALIPAQFKGRGTISGTTLDFTGRTKCLDHPPRVLPPFSSQLFYDSVTDTISDTSTPTAVVYTRVP